VHVTWFLCRTFASFTDPPAQPRRARLALVATHLLDLAASVLSLWLLHAANPKLFFGTLALPPLGVAAPLIGLWITLGCGHNGRSAQRESDATAAVRRLGAVNALGVGNALLLVAGCAPRAVAESRNVLFLPLCCRLAISQLLRSYCALPTSAHAAGWWAQHAHTMRFNILRGLAPSGSTSRHNGM